MSIKIFLNVILFTCYAVYNVNDFVKDRPQTLYDIFNISRLANFEEIKDAKNLYLENLKNKDDEDFEGDRLALMNYTLTKEEVSDSYNILTNYALKEMYDKHNLYFTENDFIKKKGKSIGNLDKYANLIKGMAIMFPFVMIIYMSFGEN